MPVKVLADLIVDSDGVVIAKGDSIQTTITGDAIETFIPLAKIDEKERMVYGYASTEALDGQGEIVEKNAVLEALPEYSKWRNVREMHQAKAIGTAPVLKTDTKGLWIGAKIVDDSAWKKCVEGVYKGFSIGGKRLGRATRYLSKLGQTVPIVTKMRLTEISLVDRPANPECLFSLAKMESATKLKSVGGNKMPNILKMLKDLVTQTEEESGIGDLAKAFGSEEVATEIAKHLDPDAPEEKKVEMINAFAKALGIEIVKDEAGGDEEEKPEEKPEDKPEEKPEEKPEDKPEEKPDAEKSAQVEDILKRLEGLETAIKTLSDEGGLTKALSETSDILKKAGEAVTAFEEIKKAQDDLLERTEYLETLRGIRRSGSPELEKGAEPDGGWGSVLSGGNTVESD